MHEHAKPYGLKAQKHPSVQESADGSMNKLPGVKMHHAEEQSARDERFSRGVVAGKPLEEYTPEKDLFGKSRKNRNADNARHNIIRGIAEKVIRYGDKDCGDVCYLGVDNFKA
jgi:hypothetical protein